MKQPVKVWEEARDIETYGVGEPNKNPMFLEKRVYQGSSGKVYPYPVIDKIYDEKYLKTYQLVILENAYIRIEILPEIGGRIYRALDKTNDYDFVYYNRVIKPALVGLAGPWVSGGIEFNWPQHHRPNTFGPVEYKISENNDKSATVWVSEIDRMYGTKVTTGFTLYPEKAFLEVSAQLYNRTAQAQTFLWWANPAVAVNDHTQSIFPPDVHAVFDHGKRDVSSFPIAKGVYYKMDYSAGVDISRYKNIPVPTSYMADASNYDFVGAYDHKKKAGLLHVANHHISPGKKQWTWGNGEFGEAWDRNLTDEDGPYVELMTGVYTDNQPDFSWLQPYEEKAFKQYFMPYKDIGAVKNASIHAAVNLEVDEELGNADVFVYASSLLDEATIELKGKNTLYLNETRTLSPTDTCHINLKISPEEEAENLRLVVRNKEGAILVAYQPEKIEEDILPDPLEPMPEPKELTTTEELYLAGIHLEQYRHATFEAEDYYKEGLHRNPKDIRINIAYGRLLLRRGLFKESEKFFRKAIDSKTWRNPNPEDTEAFYQLGLALKLQGKSQAAFTHFYKSIWSANCQDKGYFALAQIACEDKNYQEALELIEKSLSRNTRNYNARNLKTALLRKNNQLNSAKMFAQESLRLDIANFGAYNEMYLIYKEEGEREEANKVWQELKRLMRDDSQNYLHLATEYAESGLIDEAIHVLERILSNHKQEIYPMVHYMLAFLYGNLGDSTNIRLHLERGKSADSAYCFPNTLLELVVLEFVEHTNSQDDKALYYLGNLLFDKKRPHDALKVWERSRDVNPHFATVHRNLALLYYNVLHDEDNALMSLETAFRCDTLDARVLFELDQLYKKIGHSPKKRLNLMESHLNLIEERDDLFLEYISLLNTTGHVEKAIELLESHIFHPWEGGEGKVTGQYVFAHVELGKKYLYEKKYEKAIELFKKASVYPHHLGEGKLAGAQENNIYYYLGCAYEGLQHVEKSIENFKVASTGLEEPTSAMYYNDQPPDMIFYQGLALLKLKNDKAAKRKFDVLVDYAEKHITDDVTIDYFAVSLPDFLVFEDDLNKRNTIHCLYMKALGLIGLNHLEAALQELSKVLELDPNHQGAMIHQSLAQKGLTDDDL